MKLLVPEVALYLYEYTIRPCMENCCHVWISSCNMELLNKLQNQIYRTVGPILAAFHELLAHVRNVASLTLSDRS